MVDGKDARIVVESKLSQYFKRPERRARDGKLGRPIAADLTPSDLFKQRFTLHRIRAELLARHLVDPTMSVPMRRYLVPTGGDATHDLRSGFGQRAQGEERGLDLVVVEQRKQRVQLSLHVRAWWRGCAVQPSVNQLVPVLEVDAEQV